MRQLVYDLPSSKQHQDNIRCVKRYQATRAAAQLGAPIYSMHKPREKKSAVDSRGFLDGGGVCACGNGAIRGRSSYVLYTKCPACLGKK